jgi:hypothetical protein
MQVDLSVRVLGVRGRHLINYLLNDSLNDMCMHAKIIKRRPD